ncbi:MAG: hypothetical protein PHF36_06310, partial [Candidatus Cloacimonetes bacterium]|nr:hypothetical protein [Candidatus Cloacimonadota bacterium]
YIPYKIFRNALIIVAGFISSILGLLYLDNFGQKLIMFIMTLIFIIIISPLPFTQLIKQRRRK